MSRFRPYLGLAVLAAGTLFSFFRIFSGDKWIIPVFAAGLGGLTVTAVLERVRLAGSVRTFLSAIAGAWFVAIFIVPNSLKLGFPDIGRLLGIARVSWLNALDSTTLLKPEPGILLLVCAGAWAGILISAPVATAGRPVLSTLPWIGLFALTSATGAPGGRWVAVLVFTAAFLTAFFCIRNPAAPTQPVQPRRVHRRAEALTVGWATVLGAIATVSGVAFASVVPGYRSPPWLSGQLQGPSSQTVISPLVQIKPQLLDERRTKLFDTTVAGPAGVAAYWRLMALDEFDGNAWGSSADYRRVKATITYPPSEMYKGRNLSLRQQFRIDGLGSPWLPAAYQATRVSGTDASVDPLSSSIIARPRVNKGTRYQVTSIVPSPLADGLRSAPSPQGLGEYTTLNGVSDAVKKIADAWTQGKPTSYEKVIAISERLRRFRYDENVPAGHSADQLLFFLTKSKAGYCEQFAASMAVLVRAIGIPARVAVGFLPGSFDGTQNAYTVTTHDAHAWPEVYFEGVGWIPFEPTPRSGVSPPNYAASATSPEITEEPVPGQEQEQPEPESTEPTVQPASPPPVPPQSRQQEPGNFLARPLAVVVLLLLTLTSVALGKRWRSRIRYRKAATPGESVRAAFFDFEDRVIDLSRPRRITQTPAEFVEEVRSGFHLDRGATTILIGNFERAVFSGGPTTDSEAREALQAAALLTSQLWANSGWVGRLGLLVSPRSLLMRSAP